MPLNFTSDVAAKVANKLTEERDRVVYVIDNEHSLAQPATITFSRSLPTEGKTHLRLGINIQKFLKVDEGLSSERIVPMTAKLDLSVPREALSTVVLDAVHDLVGLTSTAEFTSFREIGVLPQS